MAGEHGGNEPKLSVMLYIKGLLFDSQAQKDAEALMKGATTAAAGSSAQSQTSNQAVSPEETKTFKDIVAKLAGTAPLDTYKGQMQLGQKIADRTAESILNITKKMFDIASNIYEELKSASPVLKTFEDLFNLAVQLFFMPLGNKLGEVLIPAVIEMVEEITEMWDSFEGMTLSQILDTMISKGIEILARYLTKIGDALIAQGGVFAGIGSLMKSIVQILNSGAIKVAIDLIVNIMNFVSSNIGLLLAAVIEFKVLYYTMKLAEMAIDTLGPLKYIFGGAAVATLIGGTAIAAGAGALIQQHADGGYEPYSPGGKIISVSENEGEWIVPDSKVSDFITQQSATKNLNVSNLSSSGGNYTINVYGYTDSQLGDIIEDKINELSNRNRVRG